MSFIHTFSIALRLASERGVAELSCDNHWGGNLFNLLEPPRRLATVAHCSLPAAVCIGFSHIFFSSTSTSTFATLADSRHQILLTFFTLPPFRSLSSISYTFSIYVPAYPTASGILCILLAGILDLRWTQKLLSTCQTDFPEIWELTTIFVSHVTLFFPTVTWVYLHRVARRIVSL